MLRAALTGGIATGKSYCLARFAQLGAEVIDADVIARAALAPRTPGLARVVERFGPSLLLHDGSLNRPALGRIVFSDPAARADLEAIVHPVVYGEITSWLENLPPDTRVAVADIPLLFETGRRYDFDRVIVCACDPDEQLRRVMARDRLSEADARARIAAQMPLADKIAGADFVVKTDGPFEETDKSVDEVYRALLLERS
jgi:dephospho-CoA kinase